jgi:hypothetical protein
LQANSANAQSPGAVKDAPTPPLLVAEHDDQHRVNKTFFLFSISSE